MGSTSFYTPSGAAAQVDDLAAEGGNLVESLEPHQRFRELEFRSLIDRLPASSIAPTGHDAPERDTKGGLQLSLDLLGGAAPAAADDAPREQPDPLADPGGAIEHVDPRIVRTDGDRADMPVLDPGGSGDEPSVGALPHPDHAARRVA